MLAVLVTATLLVSLTATVSAAPPDDNPGKGPPELERVDFIHYAADFAPGKPTGTPGKGPGGGNGDKDEAPIDHYKLSKLMLTDTAKYYIDTSGSGVANSKAIIAITESFEAWDDITTAYDDNGGLFSYAGAPPSAAGRIQDNTNTVSWGTLDAGILAVATMWYYPGKPPKGIIEFDVVFNTLYSWGIDPDGEGSLTISVYDIQNIATHEAGHPVGLNDLYEEKYLELTMYGYSDAGETYKHSLESGDRLGAQALYGAP